MFDYFASYRVPRYCKGCDKEHIDSELSYNVSLITASDYEDSESRSTIETATIEIEWCCIEGFVVESQAIEL